YDKPLAYFVYGEITDAFLVDPYEVVFHNKTPKDNAYFTQLGKLACEPRPLYTTPAAFYQETQRGANRYLKSDELMDTVFYEIGAGSKGIIYFNKIFSGGKGYHAMPGLENAIGKLNLILQTLKDYISNSEPMPLSKHVPNLDVSTLLCADKGILILVRKLNHDEPKNNSLEIEIPEWMKLSHGFQMTLDGEQKIIHLSISDHTVTLDVSAIDKWGIYFLAAKEAE
ncbi:MAG: hypothetical protein Q8Q33_01015, partial [Chlamydiota bacterium]|nr:hypothetical protein [Chlamydiota bacterium]